MVDLVRPWATKIEAGGGTTIMNCLDIGLVLKLRQLCGGAIVRAIV